MRSRLSGENEGKQAVYRHIPDDLRNAIEPIVDEHGYELMNVETIQDRGTTVLRVTVDTPNGDGRVPVDQIASLSSELGTCLDAANVLAGAYRLEVSSPGLDRMLAREKDFVAALGSQVKLKTRRPLDGRRKFRGELVEFREGDVVLVIDGERRRVPFAEVEKANKIYSFSPADFRVEGSV